MYKWLSEPAVSLKLREYLNGNRPVFTCNESLISVQCRNVQYVYCDAELLYILQMSIYLCALWRRAINWTSSFSCCSWLYLREPVSFLCPKVAVMNYRFVCYNVTIAVSTGTVTTADTSPSFIYVCTQIF